MTYKNNLPDIRNKKSGGFSLVELAVVISVVGLLMGAAVSMLSPHIEAYRYNSTKKKMEHIADALTLYAQKHYDLPCPAAPNPTVEPFGYPRGSGTNGTNMAVQCETANATTMRHGIVPFQVLGLSENQVKDAYGSYISYTISEYFNRYKGNSDRDAQVHRQCRTNIWVDTVAQRNKNIAKARFCCPFVGESSMNLMTVIRVYRSDLNSELFRRSPMNVVGYGYGPPDDIPGTSYGDMTISGNVPISGSAIAFALISHGKNKYGAYLRDGSIYAESSKHTGHFEYGNANKNGRSLKIGPVNTNTSISSGTRYFDDIVVFRTNRQIMSMLGGPGCSRP